jgi:hypothetical protein
MTEAPKTCPFCGEGLILHRALPGRTYYVHPDDPNGRACYLDHVELITSSDVADWNRRAALAEPSQPAGRVPLPEVLFDGYAVSQALSPQAKQRTSLENVSDVLDAVVRLLRHPAGLSAADAREHSSGTAGAGERE